MSYLIFYYRNTVHFQLFLTGLPVIFIIFFLSQRKILPFFQIIQKYIQIILVINLRVFIFFTIHTKYNEFLGPKKLNYILFCNLSVHNHSYLVTWVEITPDDKTFGVLMFHSCFHPKHLILVNLYTWIRKYTF